MKRAMYEIRYWPGRLQYSRLVGAKLKPYAKACRIVKRLEKSGVAAFKAKVLVAA